MFSEGWAAVEKSFLIIHCEFFIAFGSWPLWKVNLKILKQYVLQKQILENSKSFMLCQLASYKTFIIWTYIQKIWLILVEEKFQG